MRCVALISEYRGEARQLLYSKQHPDKWQYPKTVFSLCWCCNFTTECQELWTSLKPSAKACSLSGAPPEPVNRMRHSRFRD